VKPLHSCSRLDVSEGVILNSIETTDVAIIGGGLAGLGCAKRLEENGVPYILLEGSEEIGGRVRTDNFDGFLLDRGFQVFIEAYPDVRKHVDYKKLDLQRFYAGAYVWFGGKMHRVADPIRHPFDSIQGLFNPIGTVADKLRVFFLRTKVQFTSDDDIFAREELSTEEYLKREGFSDIMINRFFRPFYQGILLAPLPKSSSRMFEFVFKMLAEGRTSLPALGIGALSKELASPLKQENIRLNSRVASIKQESTGGATVTLASGDSVKAKAVVLATEGPEAVRLLHGSTSNLQEVASKGVTCLYFDAPESPSKEPILYLNGEGPEDGPVNNAVCLSDVSEGLAPAGRALISVTVLGIDDRSDLESRVRDQLQRWFGQEVDLSGWKLLKTYRIPHAQPDVRPIVTNRDSRILESLFLAGDYRDTSSFNGALASGLKAGQDVLTVLKK